MVRQNELSGAICLKALVLVGNDRQPPRIVQKILWCSSCDFLALGFFFSLAWGPPQFQEKRSRSEKAILGALGEFRGILGAVLGIGNSILGIRNSILGMASHDLINTKPTILGATLGAIPGIAANPPGRFSFAPAFSERFFKNWGGPRAPDFWLKSNQQTWVGWGWKNDPLKDASNSRDLQATSVRCLACRTLQATFRKILVSVYFLSAILGPEMAAPIFRGPRMGGWIRRG